MRRYPSGSDKRFSKNRSLNPNSHNPTQKRAQTRPSLAIPRDYGTPERRQHARLTLQRTDDIGNMAARVVTECMLDWLQQAGHLPPKCYEAGLRLRRDFTHAKVEGRSVMRYAPALGRNDGQKFAIYERSEHEERAYRSWQQALLVAGMSVSEALVTICCLDARPLAGQHRHLVEGLEKLVKHYGL